jgi:predicted Rossmann fold flavoprotein
MKIFDAIILGAGAAGLMCAIQAGKRSRRAVILERAERAGKKILISGGGRCNFTNLYCRPENFLSRNPHFARSALARYTPDDFVSLVEQHGIAYHEKTLGQLFCDHSARQIVDMLTAECRSAGAQTLTGAHVQQVDRSDAGFTVRTADEEFCAPALVVATGGLSIPKMGATSFGYELARQFGITVSECRPALVPFTFNAEDRDRYCDLAGVSAEVITSIGAQQFREMMLFTHRGLSGPAILQISSYWKPGEQVNIDLAPDREITSPLLGPQARRDVAWAKNVFRSALPARLGERWLEHHLPSRWTNPGIAELERQVHHWLVRPQGTEGYEKAEVTAGGVDTDELSSRTMECRRVPGLFFIGEVVDVTGHLGGFNFQWAWASGFCAGQAL